VSRHAWELERLRQATHSVAGLNRAKGQTTAVAPGLTLADPRGKTHVESSRVRVVYVVKSKVDERGNTRGNSKNSDKENIALQV